MPDPTKTEITNAPEHPVPVQQVQPAIQAATELTKVYKDVGPNGFFIVLAGVIMMALMTMFWLNIRSAQEASKLSQDHLYKQLEKAQETADKRETVLVDRADKLSKDQFDRWEKSREKSEELRSEVKAMGSKVDSIISDIKAINIYLKLQPKEKP